MKKKLLSSVMLIGLFVNPFSFTFAKTKLIYERSKDLAIQYIENSLEDDNWKDNNPKITGEGTYYFTDNDKNPSYIEFKISCDNTPDCGFILVNSDGDDVAVPMASSVGNGPSEVLISKNGGDKEKNKLYYFSPFEQFSENETTGDVISIDPSDDIEPLLEYDTKLTDEEKISKRNEKKSELKNRIMKSKENAQEYKKTQEFKDKKEEIKDQILSVPEENFVMKNLNTANAAYVNPGASNVFVASSDNASSGICSGKTPCYDQFQTVYGQAYCYNGCAPTAVGILFGYYDRNGYTNLYSGTAPLTNDLSVNTNMIKVIGDMMGTYCSGTSGATSPSNIKNGRQYAINKGYINTTSSYSNAISTSTVFNETKNEINSGRPIIIGISTGGNHAVVGFGYRNVTTSKVVRMNMGWGGALNYSGYYTSNIDQNLDAIYYNSSNNKVATYVVKFKISN